ncbi:MAG: LysM peptidoglycan-binding domain-containing protein, partial [Enterococcus sp.]|uniref:LysM peptidoglycan-binding domain-containing protein n=1 Tax=Enterococcus sp. TaxID=35783 RepID=UPI003993BD43
SYSIRKKGLFLFILLVSYLLIASPEKMQATTWQANSVETISAKLKEGQNSYTFEVGDTFYNIGLAVNVKWQTLMALNGFEEGSQYTVPVGTTIKFDGSRITVIDPNGHTITDKELTDQDKIDPAKPFAQQQSEYSQPKGTTKTRQRSKKKRLYLAIRLKRKKRSKQQRLNVNKPKRKNKRPKKNDKKRNA